MSSSVQISNYTDQAVPPQAEQSWYALHTYPRHEKRVAAELANKGIQTYLPLITRVHQWSDRRRQVELPLFPCYTFVRITPSTEERVRVLRTGGVISLVGGTKEGVPIPENQIDDLRTLVTNRIPFDPYPFLKIGQRVRVCGGSLNGLEGILIRRDGKRRLVMSVESIERSLSICIEGLEVEAA